MTEKELERALRRLVDAIWEWDMPTDPPAKVNRAYIAAQALLAKRTSEKLKAKTR